MKRLTNKQLLDLAKFNRKRLQEAKLYPVGGILWGCDKESGNLFHAYCDFISDDFVICPDCVKRLRDKYSNNIYLYEIEKMLFDHDDSEFNCEINEDFVYIYLPNSINSINISLKSSYYSQIKNWHTGADGQKRRFTLSRAELHVIFADK